MDETQKVVKKNKGVITIVMVAIIALGIGFFGGVEYQKGQKTTKTGMQAGFPSGSGRPSASGKSGTGRTGGMQPVSGEITSVDSTGITVKTLDGGSKIILLSSSTKISLATTGSTTDLKKGATVTIIGITGTDGTVSASSIAIGTVMQAGQSPNGGKEQPPQGN